MGLEYAKKLDREDPLAMYRERFIIPKRESLDINGKTTSLKPILYMDGNSLGLLSQDAKKEVMTELDRWATLTTRGSGIEEKACAMQAKLVGAQLNEVILSNGATVNIHVLVSTFYNPTGKRTKILTDELNFPSDNYALWGQVRLKGRDPDKDLVWVKSRDGRTIAEEDIIAAMSNEICVLHLPSVYYTSGQLLNMKRLTKAAHDHGIIIGFDCCHSIGVVPHKFDEWEVDYALWCNYKYMNGGSGAVAGLYVNKKHFGTMPGLPGWWGNSWSNRFDFEQKFKPSEDAGAWHVGGSSALGLAAVYGATKLVDEVGVERIREKSLKITGYLMFLIDELLSKKPYNFSVGNPREAERRGGHVACEHAEGKRISWALAARGVPPDFRPPKTIRLSPIPLYTSYSEVWEVAQHLKNIIDNKEYEKYDPNQRGMY
jgi:kynureninase